MPDGHWLWSIVGPRLVMLLRLNGRGLIVANGLSTTPPWQRCSDRLDRYGRGRGSSCGLVTG